MPRADKQRTAPPKQGAAPYAKPHACPHCAAAFGRASDLTRHVRTVHPDNSQGEVADCPPSLEAAAVVLSADHILEALLR